MTEAGLPPLVIVLLPLIGAVVGAGLAGGVRYALDRRAESTDFRAAVRVLIDDLTQVRGVLDRAAGASDVLGVARSALELDPRLVSLLEVGAWKTERRLLSRGLIEHLPAWDAARWAVQSTATLRRLYEQRARRLQTFAPGQQSTSPMTTLSVKSTLPCAAWLASPDSGWDRAIRSEPRSKTRSSSPRPTWDLGD